MANKQKQIIMVKSSKDIATKKASYIGSQEYDANLKKANETDTDTARLLGSSGQVHVGLHVVGSFQNSAQHKSALCMRI